MIFNLKFFNFIFRFRVSSSLQKLYLTACLQPPCLDITSKPVYELLLVCTDNNGMKGV